MWGWFPTFGGFFLYVNTNQNQNKMENYIEEVHISRISHGDTIIHNGVLTTVTNRNIKYSEFMGISIFGDCYHLGYKLVKRVTNVGMYLKTKE
jgi:hypothetical protein